MSVALLLDMCVHVRSNFQEALSNILRLAVVSFGMRVAIAMFKSKFLSVPPTRVRPPFRFFSQK